MTEAEQYAEDNLVLDEALRLIAAFIDLGLSHSDSKKCAIILVNEVLNVHPNTLLDEQQEYNFWVKVKEKLS